MKLTIQGEEVECCEKSVKETGIEKGQLFLARGRTDHLLTCRDVECDYELWEHNAKFVFADETSYVYDARNAFKVIAINGEKM